MNYQLLHHLNWRQLVQVNYLKLKRFYDRLSFLKLCRWKKEANLLMVIGLNNLNLSLHCPYICLFRITDLMTFTPCKYNLNSNTKQSNLALQKLKNSVNILKPPLRKCKYHLLRKELRRCKVQVILYEKTKLKKNDTLFPLTSDKLRILSQKKLFPAFLFPVTTTNPISPEYFSHIFLNSSVSVMTPESISTLTIGTTSPVTWPLI